MKFRLISLLLLLIISTTISKDKNEYVVSNSSHLALYKNRDRNPNEPAIARVSNSEILKIEKKRDSYYLVTTGSGKRGWVKKWLVKPMNFNVSVDVNSDQNKNQLTLASNDKKDPLDIEIADDNSVLK